MNISELLNSTYSLGYKRQPSYTFSQKPFGQIYAYNKEVQYKPGYSIIEISMYITAVTQKDRSAHRVRIALKGIDIEEYTRAELLEKIRKENGLGETDEEVLLSVAFKDDIELIQDKYILPANQSGTRFLVIDKRIALTTQVRVDCTCADYYYTFAWYNCDHKVAIGRRPPPYKRVMRKSDRVETIRNPKKKPGCCKHLLLFIAMLMEGGLLNTSKKISSSYNAYSGDLEVVSRKSINRMIDQLQYELKEFKKGEKLRHKENKAYIEAEKLRKRMVY